ncbi:uncharacterized protein BT62DRAFT_914381 [Guyanagaster necrorhizus]|uniref:Uncharacterized protein n=1 Tax=Guyanagaster necrorhizus TaxID=856835 RepID=A0A9P7VEF2_9AGAR|nr:uncharacterized protein BT62DRAFT_914381 [Guyanagaster necrorhizus MCA 3950]KAG7439194.1 hypothetical protein BT62DRAFT_914381 [Guyanagaster necrorhizus MCA 3950]
MPTFPNCLNEVLPKLLQSDHTLEKAITTNLYHISIVHHTLNKKLESSVLGMLDKIKICYHDQIDTKGLLP